MVKKTEDRKSHSINIS